MAASSTAAAEVHSGAAAFVAAAAKWTSGRAFPVLDGPALSRYAALFADGSLPQVEGEDRQGRVVSTGGSVGQAAGQLLAAATNRPHEHVPVERLLAWLSDHSGELVAVVGLAAEVGAAGDWPGRTGARVGLVVARTEEALSALVYRSLTAEAAAHDADLIIAHPLLDGAMDADATTLRGVAGKGRPRVLVLFGQGRECCNSALDTMLCGRRLPLGSGPLTVVDGMRHTPCVQGHACFRTDLDRRDLISACDVNALLVFTHSCSSISIGTNAYPLDISVTLGLLEGTAAAVIGVLGVHVAHPSTHADLLDALAERLPLGEVVRRVEERAGPLSGELKRFGLLGDPGLVLEPVADGRQSPTRPLSTTPGRLGRRSSNTALLADLGQVHGVVSRLDQLAWLGIDIFEDDVRRALGEVREIGRAPGADAAARVDALKTGLVELQTRVVGRLVDRIHAPGWDPGWNANAFRQTAADEEVCPGCHRPLAVRLRLTHRVDSTFHLQTLQCRRCGDVWWTTESGTRTVVLRGPVDVQARRGERLMIERELLNRGDEVLRGAVGHAFRGRRNLGVPSGAGETCEVAPGGIFVYRAEVTAEGSDTLPVDAHTLPVVGILNGVFVSSMTILSLE